MRALLAAVRFLTVLPAGRHGEHAPPGPGALVAFPLVGALLGVLWTATGLAGLAVGGPLVGAAFVLAADLAVTGGLHLDACADVADGIASRLPPAQALAVMRDPRVGGVGAAALVTVLLLRFALLSAALSTPAVLPAPEALVVAALLVPVPAAGRAAMVWAVGRMPVGEGSASSALHPAANPGVRVAAVAGAAALALVCLGLLLPPARAVAGAVAALAVLVSGPEVGCRWWSRRFGLPSGDAVGAIGVAAEILVLGVLVTAT